LKLAALIAQTERRLRTARLHYGHGTDNPRDEAAYLVLRGLGLPFDTPLDREADPEKTEKLVKARIEKRIPVAYLLREAWLDGVPFYVDKRVIIPRSHIAGLLKTKILPGPVRRVLDLCTGSGCLAVLAARAFPRARLDASDISAAALAVARINMQRHRMEKRIRLVRSDLFASLGDVRYDVILSNPPYVSAAAMRRLPAEYRYEPRMSLAAGHDGLDLVERILAEAPAHLAPGGVLVCEVGDGRKAVERRFAAAPLIWPRDEVFVVQASKMG
jgi:ribosomal protein L3 glutamine methyltransferase